MPGSAMKDEKALFRREIFAERQTQWLGTVLLIPRISHRLFATFGLFAAASILSLLFFGHFTRKERLQGLLVPHHGLVQVFAPQSGVVTEIYVQEGAEVHKGDRLFALSTELQSALYGATQTEVARRLTARRDSLIQERQQHDQLALQQMRSLSDRLLASRKEEEQLGTEIRLQQERLALAKKSEGRQSTLRKNQLISDEELQAVQAGRLDQESKLHSLERLQATMRRERITFEGQLADLPLQSKAESATLERSISSIEQDLAEAEARREIIVPAPTTGLVTSLQAGRGTRATSSIPLLSIVPSGSMLEAQLFSPSRAIGFLRPGQRVQLRYQAYPYQKFGHHEGRLTAISRSAMNPSELPPNLSGLTSLFGGTEPVYRITIGLASQTVTAYGHAVPLQVGMQLEADVEIERRRLVEWILEPLFTLTGKWKS
jgi:membrane fusion protein